MSSSPPASGPEGIRPAVIKSPAIATTGDKYATAAMRVAPQRRTSATMSKNATAEDSTPAAKMDTVTFALNAAGAGAVSHTQAAASKITAEIKYW